MNPKCSECTNRSYCPQCLVDLETKAARWDWLETKAQSSSLDMDGTAYYHLGSSTFSERARSFAEAVDRRMKRDKDGE